MREDHGRVGEHRPERGRISYRAARRADRIRAEAGERLEHRHLVALSQCREEVVWVISDRWQLTVFRVPAREDGRQRPRRQFSDGRRVSKPRGRAREFSESWISPRVDRAVRREQRRQRELVEDHEDDGHSGARTGGERSVLVGRPHHRPDRAVEEEDEWEYDDRGGQPGGERTNGGGAVERGSENPEARRHPEVQRARRRQRLQGLRGENGDEQPDEHRHQGAGEHLRQPADEPDDPPRAPSVRRTRSPRRIEGHRADRHGRRRRTPRCAGARRRWAPPPRAPTARRYGSRLG